MLHANNFKNCIKLLPFFKKLLNHIEAIIPFHSRCDCGKPESDSRNVFKV